MTCRSRSLLLAALRLISGGAIPERMYRLLNKVSCTRLSVEIALISYWKISAWGFQPNSFEEVCFLAEGYEQWRNHWGARGAECHPWQWKICQKSGKNQEKLGKKRKNREEKATIGMVLSLCPTWQIGLATLLATKTCKIKFWKFWEHPVFDIREYVFKFFKYWLSFWSQILS